MKIRQLFELRGVLFSSPLQQILAPNGVRKTGNENNYHPGIPPQQTSHSRTVSLFLNGIGKVIISCSVIAFRGWMCSYSLLLMGPSVTYYDEDVCLLALICFRMADGPSNAHSL
ncbi:hypothetical protein CDAR_246931 [Caerostris darwini]|uniref:Uncharacterized protein n=1 Tax=Caerostris darwini TaxID=1538125 RepID=A0AAV4WYY4_9ARAC|nr:hypothetical protein CDAR_246931 [Caerostris darwini]